MFVECAKMRDKICHRIVTLYVMNDNSNNFDKQDSQFNVVFSISTKWRTNW